MEKNTQVPEYQQKQSTKATNFKKLQDQFLYYAQDICPGFTIDNDNRDVINLLLKYATGGNISTLNPGKGLFLHGLVGCGKTILIKAIVRLICNIRGDFDTDSFNEKKRLYIGFHTSRQLRDLYLDEGMSRLKKISLVKHLIIDDVGCEDTTAQYFGNEVSPVAEVILDRYEQTTDPRNYKYKFPIYVTSNLTGKELTNIYGERFTSRLREMCNDVYLPGNDRRK